MKLREIALRDGRCFDVGSEALLKINDELSLDNIYNLFDDNYIHFYFIIPYFLLWPHI